MQNTAASCLVWPNGGGLDDQLVGGADHDRDAISGKLDGMVFGVASNRQPGPVIGAKDALDFSNPDFLQAYTEARAESLHYKSARMQLGRSYVAGQTLPDHVKRGEVALGSATVRSEKASAVIFPGCDAQSEAAADDDIGRSTKRRAGITVGVPADSSNARPAGTTQRDTSGAARERVLNLAQLMGFWQASTSLASKVRCQRGLCHSQSTVCLVTLTHNTLTSRTRTLSCSWYFAVLLLPTRCLQAVVAHRAASGEAQGVSKGRALQQVSTTAQQ